MSSLSTVLASMPPASLVETDLARFCALAIGRRSRGELPGLAALFGEETLRGYPASLGPILHALVQTVMQHNLDPNGLDARTVDGLLGTAGFLARLDKKVSVQRQRLRPGTIISATLRQTLGMRLLVLPGVGKELVLVAPVDLAQVPDAHFAVPLGIVLARQAPHEEAEILRATWAAIEERFGLAGEEAAEWSARFLAISRRENHDARGVAEALDKLPYERRMILWEALVAHLRDAELPEQHRTGRRGLERRLSELGLMAAAPIPEWIDATLALVESVYHAAGLDPEVMAGRCPVPAEDVERWASWVDVPAAGRDRVRKLSTEAIASALVRLAEEEAGRIERNPDVMPEALARGLASLRDGCLRPRWQRSHWALVGVDPLLLARTRLANGEDTHAIREQLEALADEALKTPRAVVAKPTKPAPAARPEGDPGEPEPSRPVASESRELVQPTPKPPEPEVELLDPRGLRPSRFHLPPMPSVPPPRPAPRVRPRTDFPAMPAVPERSRPPTDAPRARPPEGNPPGLRGPATIDAPRARPATRQPEGFRSAEVVREAAREVAREVTRESTHSPREPAREPTREVAIARETTRERPATGRVPPRAPIAAEARIARPRTGATAPHLVTPTQGNEFYDASFRELELIERDLVQRGPYSGAAERVQAITAEAAELYQALGPSARSGDREFQAAQRRIEKVQAYLDRIRPLLNAARTSEPDPREQPKGGLLSRLFGKNSQKA